MSRKKKPINVHRQLENKEPPSPVAGTLIHLGNYFDPTQFNSFKQTLKEFSEWCFEFLEVRPIEYVICFSHGKLYGEAPSHTILVKKKPGSLHEGHWNLPGGKVQENETPFTTSLRELKEETGMDATFPQLIGAIIPSPWMWDTKSGDMPFIVYVYRLLLNDNQTLTCPEDQPGKWVSIEHCMREVGPLVPNIPVLLSLCATSRKLFLLQDSVFNLDRPLIAQTVVTTYQQLDEELKSSDRMNAASPKKPKSVSVSR